MNKQLRSRKQASAAVRGLHTFLCVPFDISFIFVQDEDFQMQYTCRERIFSQMCDASSRQKQSPFFTSDDKDMTIAQEDI